MSRASSPGSTPPPSRLNAEDRKQSLIDAAAQILVTAGVDAVRMPEVAEAAGVTRPIVYRHFENRHALNRLDGFDDQLDLFAVAAFAEIRNAFDDLFHGGTRLSGN